jgi:hypothetical protein
MNKLTATFFPLMLLLACCIIDPGYGGYGYRGGGYGWRDHGDHDRGEWREYGDSDNPWR